ncbi:MAG: XRE family transcriptional regulator [Syntrophales bacterium]|nr:XRE family transcriptional regulator [Syntrophales bacterium]
MTQNEDIKSGAVKGFKIGGKVRELRQKRHYTMKDLSIKTDLSKTLLSEIENDEVVPPVATLLKLAKALGVGMTFFFEDVEISEKISVTRPGERIQLKRRPHHHEGEVDYVYEILETKKPDKRMLPLLVEFQPMDRSDMIFTNHEGEEFLYLIEGTLEFRTDDRMEVLQPGDSLYFESDINHSFRALDEKQARAVVVVWSKT